MVKGFHAALNKYNDFRVWINEQTQLPVRVELTHPESGKKIIITDFEYEVDFDESLFCVTPPPGYTVVK